MNHKARIAEAFVSNGIRSVLLVDDAYDPPDMNDDVVVALSEFLRGDSNRDVVVERGATEQVVEAARRAADDGDSESEALGEVYRLVYEAFAGGDRRCDVGGYFERMRGPALDLLRPLQTLLKRCGRGLEVKTAGIADGLTRYREMRPQVLFLDYLLADGLPPVGDVREDALSGARAESVSFLRDIAGGPAARYPAIVLMSSRDIRDAEAFRDDASSGRIMKLRYRQLNKRWLRLDGRSIHIDHAAADVLLDTSQGYAFGELLEESIGAWRDGVERALVEFGRKVGQWDKKEIAYLLRFRLREEGQPLSEYLEWLFGEYFGALIEREVNWKHNAFSEMDSDGRIGEDIEGAYDEASGAVADCFHKVRVRTERVGPPSRYRLGDLYRCRSEGSIRVIVTPDCDLVVRKGKASVASVLTMGGILRRFDKKGASIDNFVVMDDGSYSVAWKPKDLRTFPINGDGALHVEDGFEFVGTLRPLYAQAMQRRALTDLWRVGVPVAPALGVRVNMSVWVRLRVDDDKEDFEKIAVGTPASAVLIPGREGREGQRGGSRILVGRRFIWDLIDRLTQMRHERRGGVLGSRPGRPGEAVGEGGCF